MPAAAEASFGLQFGILAELIAPNSPSAACSMQRAILGAVTLMNAQFPVYAGIFFNELIFLNELWAADYEANYCSEHNSRRKQNERFPIMLTKLCIMINQDLNLSVPMDGRTQPPKNKEIGLEIQHL